MEISPDAVRAKFSKSLDKNIACFIFLLLQTMNQLKIAYNGTVKQDGRSGNVAQFLVLKELLDRGFEIDFYGKSRKSNLTELSGYSNFNFIETDIPTLKAWLRKYLLKFFPAKARFAVERIVNISIIRSSASRLAKQTILSNHRLKKYDLVLTVERYSNFNIAGIPNISWVQGPPKRQWYMIQKLKKQVISLCGRSLYLKLKLFYALKEKIARADINFSDRLICSSQGSKDWIVSFGYDAESIDVIPYPVDLNSFKPQANLKVASAKNRDKIFLWLGRSEPRKRLDLLLEAYELLLAERKDVKLRIFGGFSWAPGYKKLIDNFSFPKYLEYCPNIEREEVPKLMSECDFLIQPSEWENFGTAVAEAQCCGLPVIIGSTNGTKDHVSSSSFVFEEYSPECLKETMIESINCVDEENHSLRTDARETAETNFNVVNVVNRLEKSFHKAIELKQLELGHQATNSLSFQTQEQIS